MLKALNDSQDKTNFVAHFEKKKANNYKTHAELLNDRAVKDFIRLYDEFCPGADVTTLYLEALREISASSLILPLFFIFFVSRKVIHLYFI
jgi:hypothetical protein